MSGDLNRNKFVPPGWGGVIEGGKLRPTQSTSKEATVSPRRRLGPEQRKDFLKTLIQAMDVCLGKGVRGDISEFTVPVDLQTSTHRWLQDQVLIYGAEVAPMWSEDGTRTIGMTLNNPDIANAAVLEALYAQNLVDGNIGVSRIVIGNGIPAEK